MRAAVVIPNWNGSRWLTGCLDAVAAQTRPPDEVIVVDDASRDNSVAVAQAHPLAPTVIALERNGGFARAVNHGIRAASADAVALVNVDVVLAADWLERTILALEADPRAASVATKMVSSSATIPVISGQAVALRATETAFAVPGSVSKISR